jgi:hypothetical protein
MRRLSLLVALAACPAPIHTRPARASVRLCNDTGFAIRHVTWGSTYTRDSLAAGTCTGYETPAMTMYGYTYVKFDVKTDEFLIQPIDYMGEVPLDAGEWSYHLAVLDYAKRHADVSARRDLNGVAAILRVRTCNDSDRDFTAVVLTNVPQLDNVTKHSCTPYVEVDRAFRDAAAGFTVGNDSFEIPYAHADHITSLEPGDWSYHFAIVDYDKRVARLVASRDNP